MDCQSRVLGDKFLVVQVDMEGLTVSDHQVKVCDLAKLLEPDDAPLEVPHRDMEAVTRDRLEVQVVLELEPDRHFVCL